ncbi:peptidoglycan-binding protein [Hartmannibacter diazotrophicus]|nr:peptidoglycan-binding protein [Hartmannibacter diazotrophicus]
MVAALAALAIGLPTGVLAAERAAFVVAAEDYTPLSPSRIGLKKGEAVVAALRQQGFDVVVSTSPTNATSRAKLREFADLANGADLAIAVLIGHGASTGGQTFFLPVNTSISRSTDLLSRALSIASIAQITERAKASGVFFFVTNPAWPDLVPGLDNRPTVRGEERPGHFVMLSTSPSIPVSQIDNASLQATDDFIAAISKADATLASALSAAEEGGRAVVIGKPVDIALVKPPPAPEPPPVAAAPAPVVAAPGAAAGEKKLEAEREAREKAETEAAAERDRAEEARLSAQKAQADVARAQAEAAKAQAEAERAQAEAAKAQAQAEAAKAEAAKSAAEAEAVAARERARASALIPINEADLGWSQKRLVQEKLRDLGHYRGPIDAIIGPLTRQGIMAMQRDRGDPVTGYLTAEQYNILLTSGQ